MKQNLKRWTITTFLGVILLALCACGTQGGEFSPNSGNSDANSDISFESMVWQECVKRLYADQFHVESCGEYRLITIEESGQYLLVPEGEGVPANLSNDIVVMQGPLQNTYVAATSAFDLIREIGALEDIRFSGTKANDLYISEVAQAMEDGDILYAGKYSAPDYELLLSGQCDLAIESTMIYHNPETKEKLEALDIPVLVERSSYESHPLGRMEWIKLYGVLYGCEEEAENFFAQQMEALEPIMNQDSTGRTVAFFYVNTNRAITVRKADDYIAKMISLAGGNYILEQTEGEDNALSTTNMQMEDFYLAAKDADIIIYNGTIVGELGSIDDLVAKNQLFADFKAVKEGNVYSTGKNFFQETTSIGYLMEDLSIILRDPQATQLHQLTKLR